MSDAVPLQLTALEVTGRLRCKPHVAARAAGDRFLPVLILELCEVGAGRHSMIAQIPYTEATRKDAEEQAKRLQPGQLVTVANGLEDIRVLLPAARLVSVSTPQP